MRRLLPLFIALLVFSLRWIQAAEIDLSKLSFAQNPDHVVLFVIDGLSYKVWSKLHLPILTKMVESGSLVEKTYLPPPAHPRVKAYADLHTCSIPNPIMMAGTIFISPHTEYLPQIFFPKKATAFVANSTAYITLTKYYNYCYLQNSDDSASIEWALKFMREGKPAFIRVHLQQPGEAGSESLMTEEEVSWKYNIWAKEAPYRKAIEKADSLLGEFIGGLQEIGILERTALIVLGDHGQSDTGWHPAEILDSAITTTVFWGAGIKKGVKIPYAEMIDIVPTICLLMKLQTPSGVLGRPIVEACSEYKGMIPLRTMQIAELNQVFLEYHNKLLEFYNLIGKVPAGRQQYLFTQLRWEVLEKFYDINRFPEWPEFNSVKELLDNNRQVLDKLKGIINDLKKHDETHQKFRDYKLPLPY